MEPKLKLDGNKTRLGLVLSSLSVLSAQAAAALDGDQLTKVDLTVAIPAAVVLYGAAHAIWKDWRGPKAGTLNGEGK